MFNRQIVQKALKQTWALDNIPGSHPGRSEDGQGRVTSRLIYDVFGGEILKTHTKRNWHFYNRINGERVDFTGSKMIKSSGENRFEDIPSAPDETFNYFAQEDYSNLFIKFIRIFEEAVGLEQYRPGAII
jgi:hypothetical protein